MDLISPAIQSYAESLTSPESELLKSINDFTKEHRREYHMLSGHLQGKALEMISHMIRPKRVLEIGTFTGYSAICLAAGLQSDGKLHTIEAREEDARTAAGFFARSSFADRIILHTGNALDIIPGLDEDWDLVFIDADKPAYIEYFKLVLPRVRKNGFILADNIFFHGDVLSPEPTGKSAKGIVAFNEFMKTRADVEKCALTLRDGLMLIRKI